MFPASAGMNRARRLLLLNMTNVPRKRGDEPMLHEKGDGVSLCSPQARG